MGEASRGQHWKGVVLVLLAGLAWSSGGPLMRAIEAATPWQILFYRSSGMLAIVLGYLAFDLRGATWASFRALGGWGLLAGAFIATAFSLFIVAMRLTSVANTLFMISISPLFAAVVGGWVLHERVRRATWVAIAIAGAGLAVMVWDGMTGGGLAGNFASLGSALAFASFTLTLRHLELSRGLVDLRPALAIGALIGIVVSGSIALIESGTLILSWQDTAYALTFGVFQVGLGLILYIAGAKYLTAAEATLLALSEVVLGALWTWLIFTERPTETGLVGGTILLGAMVLQAASGMQRRRPPPGLV